MAILAAVGGSEIVLIPGTAYRVGRDSGCDLSLGDPSVSRHHATLDWFRSHRGWTWVDAAERTNPSRVDGREARRGTREPVDGRSDIWIGGTRLFLIDAPREVQGRLLDPTTGLVVRSVFARELERRLRVTRQPHRLATLDIDQYRGLHRQLGDEACATIRRRMATVVLNWSAAIGVPRLLLCADEDRFHVAFPPELRDFSSSDVVSVLRAQLEQVGLAEHGATLSGGMLPVTVEDRDPFARVAEKVVQAKIAGGGRLCAGGALPRWYRSRVDELTMELRSGERRTVALVVPRGRDQSDPLLRTRKLVAESLDGFPEGARVSVAWTSGALAMNASTDAGAVRKALSGLESDHRVVVQEGDVGPGWFHRTERQLTDGARQRPVSDLVLADATRQLSEAAPEQRARIASQQLERALCYLTWTLMVPRLTAAVEAPASSTRLLSVLPTAAHGMGSWLHCIQSLVRDPEPNHWPVSLRSLLTSGWLDRTHGAKDIRNRATHHDARLADEMVSRIRRTLRDLGGAFTECDWELWRVDAVHNRRRSATRLVYGRMVQAQASEYQAGMEVEADLAPGTWWRSPSTNRWMRASPFIHAAECPDCGRSDVFLCHSVPTGHGPLQLSAHGHELSWEPDPYSDPEYLTLVRSIGQGREVRDDLTYVGPMPGAER